MNYLANRMQYAVCSYLKRRERKIVFFGPKHIEVTKQAYRGKNKPLPVSKLLSRILFGENYQKRLTFQYTKLRK